MRNRDEEMLALYCAESEQNLRMLDDLLLGAQCAGTLGSSDIAEAFRLVHTLKGASAMMGYQALAQSAHSLEDILSALRGQDAAPSDRDAADILDVCFQYADHTAEQLSLIKAGADLPPAGALDAALARVKDALHIERAPVADMPITPEMPATQAPPGSARVTLRLRPCPMPHIRCSVILKSVRNLCEQALTVPRDIELHPELAARILDQGLTLHVIPKRGVELAQIADKLAAQPFVTAAELPDPEAQPGDKRRAQTVRVPQGTLNELIAVLSELTTTQSMLADALEAKGGLDSRAAYLMGRLRHDAARARDLSAEMGMVEIGSVFQTMRRLVRMTAQEYGKRIAFVSEGDAVAVDGSMVELISDALLHLVRNAVDHGVEMPDARARAGKNAEGTIAITAEKENGLLLISVSDDGRGVDCEAVLRKASEKGLIPPDQRSCTDGELLDILASPGFSTKADVTAYAGRGVGLDTAVRRVRDMRGTVSLASAPGKGSVFTLRIPTTLSLIHVFALSVGRDRVLIPAAAVQTVRFARDAVEADGSVRFRDEIYRRLDAPGCVRDGEGDVLVFLAPRCGRYYLRAASADMPRELPLSPLPRLITDRLGADNLFGGCCAESDGAILCVLDVDALVARHGYGRRESR